MVTHFTCPYLGGTVELTDEREQHIAANHPDLLPAYRWCIAEALTDPDQVRRSERFGNARLLSRWFSSVRDGKQVVVVVVTETGVVNRHWIITAYMARRLTGGEIEWQRN